MCRFGFDIASGPRRLALLCAVPFLMGVPALAGTVLYDNGAIVGTQGFGAPTIGGSPVTDSFLLASGSTITGTANVGLWITHGDSPFTVDWAITSSAFSGVLESGTAAWSSTFLFENAFQYDIYSGSFSIPNLSLAPGTYWLQLGNAVTTPAASFSIFWDRSVGPSQAFDGPGIPDPAGSESFQIIGNVNTSGVPEPSSVLLIGSGLLGLAGLGKRPRK